MLKPSNPGKSTSTVLLGVNKLLSDTTGVLFSVVICLFLLKKCMGK
jgi:hypothetical protein